MKTTNKITGAQTRLERHVQNWINQQAKNYDPQDAKDVLEDLFYGGCQSGYVSHLIYYKDTLKFFATHRREISQLLKDALENVGGSPKDLFGEKWDDSDPLAQETQNRNLLAWFGFEETARILADRNEIEI